MKKSTTLGIVITVSCIFGLAVKLTYALENEPDSFHGIKWGTHISENRDEMIKNNGGPQVAGVASYQRKGDDRLYQVPALVILYYYKNDRFSSVKVVTKRSAYKATLLDGLRAQYGEASNSDTSNENNWLHVWRWDRRTQVTFTCFQNVDQCVVDILRREDKQ